MSRSIADLLVGRTLGERYRIEESIGSGGMSVIYRATDQRLGRPVAVKVISLPEEGQEARAEHRERLRREAASAASIPPHPNVVQVYDYGTDAELDLDFIVMELLRGRDLKSALREGPIPLPEALRLLREAARGVSAGHRAGIVHRDVKPANLLLVGDRQVEAVKVLDFGIAKALQSTAEDDLTRTGLTPHSPAYASPEQLRPGEPLTAASDVYQLGLVGYELLAGERPYTDRDRDGPDLGAGPRLPERGRWAAVPASVRSVVERALHPDPRERYPDAASMAEALAHADDATLVAPTSPWADDSTRTLAAPPPAPPPVPPAAAPHPPQRRTGPLTGRGRTLAAAAAVLILLALVVFARRGRQAPGPDTATPEPAEIQEEFRDLIWDAYQRLQEEAEAVEGQAAAEAVERVILELNDAWVRGDLSRHLEHYADRVEFYGDRLTRARVGELRRQTLERFPRREITISRTAIEFPEKGRARALVTKSWDMRGERGSWSGEVRQELRLALQQDAWRVVAERDLEVLR